MAKKIKIGVAGFGVVGTRRVEFLNKHPDVQVVGICDFKFAFEKPNISGIQLFESYHQLLEMDLDALFVCLTNDIAPEVTIAGLKKGLHVFCEKPPGRTVEDIVAVRKTESENPDLKLKYGFNHRYHGSVIRALEIIRSKELGQVINMRGVYGKSAIVPWPREQPAYLGMSGKKQWRTDRAVAGGGILLDQGIHMVDLMRAFGGDFTEFKSFVSNSYWKHDVEDNAYALMTNAQGVVAMLHSTATQWQHRFSLDIHLTQGSLSLTGILSGSRSYGEEKLTLVKRIDEDNGVPQETIAAYNKDESWWLEICEFIDCIKNNTRIQVGSSHEALRTMETVYAIYRADEKWNAYLSASETKSPGDL